MSVKLIIDRELTTRNAGAEEFSDVNFSMQWVNVIRRQMGSCPVSDIREDPVAVFARTSMAVVSSSVEEPSLELAEEARAFVARGGLLILEKPHPRWVTVFNQKVIQGIPRRKIQAEKGFSIYGYRILPAPYPDIISKMPICTDYYPVEKAPGVMETLLYLNESPAILQYKYQDGWVIIILFDMAMQLTALKQGIPSAPGFGVREQRGKVPFLKEPDDLLMDDSLTDNFFPYADLLESFLFAAVEDLIFLPRLWYYPYEYDGAFLMTHDDEKQGAEKSRYMMETELQRGYKSTFFIISTPGVLERWPSVEEFAAKGFDFQWHWNRLWDPFIIYPPEEQLDLINKIPGAKSKACRIHFLNWGDSYSGPFEEMEKLGITMDSTLGPNKGRGYLFGTGYPFSPIKTDGSLYNITEIPFVSQEDWNGADKKFFEKIINESAKEYHSCICPIFHPGKGAKTEGPVRELWLATFEMAKKEKHFITTFSEFGLFIEKRAEVEIISPLKGSYENITVKNGFDGIGIKVPVHPMDSRTTGELSPERVPPSEFRLIKEAGRKYMLLKYPFSASAL